MPKEVFTEPLDKDEAPQKEKKQKETKQPQKKKKKIDKEQVAFKEKLIAPLILIASVIISLIVYWLSQL